MNFDLKNLEYFVAIANHGSVNAASRGIGISQAGLMKNIAALEMQLDVPLFVRSARGVLLTEAGAAFLRHAQLILNQATRAESTIRAIGKGEDLALRIGVSSPWIEQTVMPRVMVRVSQQASTYRITVVTGISSKAMIALLKGGELDMVVATPTNLDDLEALDSLPLARLRQGLIVRSGHHLTSGPIADVGLLLNHDWVLGPPESFFRKHLNAHFIIADLPVPEPRFTTSSFDLTMSLVAKTDMIGVSINEFISLRHDGAVTMLDTPFTMDRQISVLFREGDVLADVAEELSGMLKDEMPASLRTR